MYTGISVSMVIFNKHKKNKETKFLDAKEMCTSGRRLNVSEILKADFQHFRVLAKKFIDKYGVDSTEYEVIKGRLAKLIRLYINKINNMCKKNLYQGFFFNHN